MLVGRGGRARKQLLNVGLANVQNVKDRAARLVKTSHAKPSAVSSAKSILQCSHSPRWNRLYLADTGDATYSSSDTEESVAFRLYRLEEGVRSQVILTTHMVSSCMEEGERMEETERDSSKKGTVGKNETVKDVAENTM